MKLPSTCIYYEQARRTMNLILYRAAENDCHLAAPHSLEVHDSIPRGGNSGAAGDAVIIAHRATIRLFLPNIFKGLNREHMQARPRAVMNRIRRDALKNIDDGCAEDALSQEIFDNSNLSGVILHETLHLAQGPKQMGHNYGFLLLAQRVAPIFRLKAAFHVCETLHWPLPSSEYGHLLINGPSIRDVQLRAAITYQQNEEAKACSIE